jgi:hypothetical protein
LFRVAGDVRVQDQRLQLPVAGQLLGEGPENLTECIRELPASVLLDDDLPGCDFLTAALFRESGQELLIGRVHEHQPGDQLRVLQRG